MLADKMIASTKRTRRTSLGPITQLPHKRMSPHSDPTSLTLLGRLRENQPAAWQRLVELYGPLVHHWCRRSDLSAADTADIFQDVFTTVSQSIDGFRRDRKGDTFRGWLRTITANKIRDHFRRQRGKPVAQGGTDAQLRLNTAPEPVLDEDADEQGVMNQALHRALEWIRNDFSEQTWQAFWRSQIEEHDTQDIARDLAMTPAAVRKAKYRVIRRLREELEGLTDGT